MFTNIAHKAAEGAEDQDDTQSLRSDWRSIDRSTTDRSATDRSSTDRWSVHEHPRQRRASSRKRLSRMSTQSHDASEVSAGDDSRSMQSASRASTHSQQRVGYATTVFSKGKLVMKTVHVVEKESEWDDSSSLHSDVAQLWMPSVGLDALADGHLYPKGLVPRSSVFTLRFDEESAEQAYNRLMQQQTTPFMKRFSLTVAIISVIFFFWSFGILLSSIICIFAFLYSVSMYISLGKSPNERKFHRMRFLFAVVLSISSSYVNYYNRVYSPSTFQLTMMMMLASSARLPFPDLAKILWLNIIIFFFIIAWKIPEVAVVFSMISFVIACVNCLIVCYSLEGLQRRKFIGDNVLLHHQSILEAERKRTIDILDNMYPKPISEYLQREGSITFPNLKSSTAVIVVVSFAPLPDGDLYNSVRHVHKAVDQIFSQTKVQKIKSSGNTIVGALGLFDPPNQDFEKDITATLLALNRWVHSSKIGIRVVFGQGLTWGGSIDCSKNTFDICGQELSRCVCLANYDGLGSGLYATKSFKEKRHLQRNQFERVEVFPLKIEPYHYRMENASTLESELHPFVLNGPNVLLTIEPSTPRQSNRSLEQESYQEDCQSGHHTIATDSQSFLGSAFSPPDIPAPMATESDVDAYMQRDEFLTLALYQTAVSVVFFIAYGSFETEIVRMIGMSTFDEIGYFTFIRFGIILPLLIMALWIFYLAHFPSSAGQNLRRSVRRLPIWMIFAAVLFTDFRSFYLFQHPEYLKMALTMASPPGVETRMYLDFLLAQPMASRRSLRILAIYFLGRFFLDTYLTPFPYSRDPVVIALIFVVWQFSIQSLYWKAGDFKENVRKAELQSRIDQRVRVDKIVEETENTEYYLMSLIPRAFFDELKEGKYERNRILPEVALISVGIHQFESLCQGLDVPGRILLQSEIFSEIERVCQMFELEPVKTFGPTFLIASGLGDKSGPDRVSNALMFGCYIHDYFHNLAEKNSQTRVLLQVGIAQGQCVGGIASPVRFSFDIWGDAANSANQLMNVCAPKATLVHGFLKDVASSMNEVEVREIIQYKADSEAFYIAQKTDVWQQFSSLVDWYSN